MKNLFFNFFLIYKLKNYLFFKKSDSKNIILVEFTNQYNLILSFFYFIKFLRKNVDARVIAFSDIKVFFGIKVLFSFIMQKLNLNFYAIYKRLNTNQFLFYSRIKKNRLNFIKKKFLIDQKKIKNKRQLERLKIKNILIGDLIYDTFLRDFKCSTIDIKNPIFQRYLLKSYYQFFFWYDFIKSNKIKAIIVSHSVYKLAIPLRICISRSINSYQVNHHSIYCFNKKRQNAYLESHDFQEKIKTISKKEIFLGLKKSKKKLDLRLSGKVGVDMYYSQKSSYHKKFTNKKIVSDNNKINILVATHCFFDSPHSYGFNLFPDFYEWLDFLGKLSESKDYNWYIKVHPDYLPGTLEILKDFTIKYKKFKIIDPKISHHQLIKEGIDVALTIYGTIAMEYPLLNVSVITASKKNPYFFYNFCNSPKNLSSYKKELLNLRKRKKIEINKKKIYEYYYLKYLKNKKSWLFSDYDELIRFVGSNHNIKSNKIIDYWINNKFLIEKNINKLKIQQFIKSKTYFLEN